MFASLGITAESGLKLMKSPYKIGRNVASLGITAESGLKLINSVPPVRHQPASLGITAESGLKPVGMSVAVYITAHLSA